MKTATRLKKEGVLKKKIRKVVGKLVRQAKKLSVIAAVSAIVGCATVDQPTHQPNDQKSVQAGKSETQNVEMHNSNVYIFVGVTKLPKGWSTNAFDQIMFGESESIEGHTISVLSQAQALESSGTETYSPLNTPSNVPCSTPTATPTNDVTTDLKFTYGLHSDSAYGTSWIAQLTDASLRGLASILKSKAKSNVVVTGNDGKTECVSCDNGVCTTASGDRITCSDTSCDSCSSCSIDK